MSNRGDRVITGGQRPTRVAVPLPRIAAAAGLSLSVAVAMVGSPGVAMAQAKPAARTPTTNPPTPKQVEAERLFDHLMKTYTALLGKTHDRLGRSLLLVCMARIPRADATAEILKVMRTDRDPLVAAVAWQCMLARASGVSAGEFKQWTEITSTLLPRGIFRGDMRISLAQFIATTTPSQKTRDMFGVLFASTNAMRIEDRAAISAMGRCVADWRDAQTVDWLLSRYAVLSEAYRADDVLRGSGAVSEAKPIMAYIEAGSDVQWQMAYAEQSHLWKQHRKEWTGSAEPEPWRKLVSPYLQSVDFSAEVDPGDPTWYRDLELRSPNLRTFGAALMLDTTGSMQTAINWLRTDIRRLMQALGLVALEPQIGITFFRDFGDEFITRPVPLTSNVDALAKELATMNAKGGGDEPEAHREALQATLNASRWSTSAKSPKALVFITDAKPHPQTQQECVKIVSDAAAKGFRTYVVKVRTGLEKDEGWPNLDALAEAGGGTSMDVDFMRTVFGGRGPTDSAAAGRQTGRLGTPRAGGSPTAPPSPFSPADFGAGKPAPGTNAPAKSSRPRSATDDTSRPPGERIVTQVVADLVNPEYIDRVQPVVSTLWQLLADFEPEKRMPTPPFPKIEFRPPPQIPIIPLPPMRPLPPAPPPQPYDPQRQR